VLDKVEGYFMIIVTGVSGGIGHLLVDQLLDLDHVIGVYNKTEPPTSTQSKLHYEQVDIQDTQSIKEFLNKVGCSLGKVTLINLAGVKIDGLAASLKENDWDNVLNVNLKGGFLLTQALLPYMITEKWGRIVHFASLGALQGDVGTIAYSASKAGILGMSRVFAKEYGRFNITSNVINLGYFNVGMFEKLSEDVKRSVLTRIPIGRFGDVCNIANAVRFFIESDYVNGAVINIDGGI
jgi:3-oxoacyl-[acyl-carrier protein] reductase